MIQTLNSFYYIKSPVAVMRQKPDAASEVVSQALFSEQVNWLNSSEAWIQIETIVDGYSGWIKAEEILTRKNKFLDEPNSIKAVVSRHTAHLYNVKDTIYGPLLSLPFESRLCVIEPFEAFDSRWLKVALPDDREAYIQRGDITLTPMKLDGSKELCEFSQKFLGLPYTWGGRSSFGYDCSGFMQMLYRQMGVFLPRDAKDQCHWNGFVEVAVDKLQLGDLIFFGLDSAKIRHVGMYIGEGRFIHAGVSENMPYIHISRVESQEWKLDSGKYPFRTARRYTQMQKR